MVAAKGAGPVTDSAVIEARNDVVLADGQRSKPSSEHKQDPRELVVLADLRCLSLRCKLTANEVDTIGVALKGGFISIECALEWVSNLEEPVVGLLRPREVVP